MTRKNLTERMDSLEKRLNDLHDDLAERVKALESWHEEGSNSAHEGIDARLSRQARLNASLGDRVKTLENRLGEPVEAVLATVEKTPGLLRRFGRWFVSEPKR